MSGNNHCDDLEEHYAQVYRDPEYHVTFNSILQVDEDAGGPILGDFPKVKQLLELVAQSPPAKKKWAVVIPNGFKRLLVEYVLRDVSLKPVEMRFFDSEMNALAWLNSDVQSSRPVATNH
jgi:hypothetical protein